MTIRWWWWAALVHLVRIAVLLTLVVSAAANGRHRIALLTLVIVVSISVVSFLVVLVPLTCVVHFNLSAQDYFALHFYHGLFAVFFATELDESVAF